MCNREPLFDQMIINVYHPGQGIKAHVDLAKFDDGIASVSLGSTCVMLFARQQVQVRVHLLCHAQISTLIPRLRMPATPTGGGACPVGARRSPPNVWAGKV